VIKLAYEEARAALKEQDATLSNIRNRYSGLRIRHRSETDHARLWGAGNSVMPLSSAFA
jgi:hypothetical protein